MYPTLRSLRLPAIVLALVTVTAGLGAASPAVAEIPVGGVVTDAGGRPLEGARVTLFPAPGLLEQARLHLEGDEPEPVLRTATDAAGRFELAAPRIGMWVVRVERPGYAAVELNLRPLLDAVELPAAKLDPAAELVVRVRDPRGKPVAARIAAVPDDGAGAGDGDGGRLLLRRHREPGVWRTAAGVARTGDDGEVRLAVGGDAGWTVEAVAGGYPPAVRELPRGKAGRVELTLRPGTARPVAVVDPRGEPVPGVVLYAGDGCLPLAATGEEGRATLELGDGGEGRLFFLADRGRHGFRELDAPERRRAADPDAAAEPPEVELLELAEVPVVVGQVVDARTRDPIAGALAWALGALGDPVETDGQGYYRLYGGRSLALHMAAARGYAVASAMNQEAGTREAPGDATGPTLALEPVATVAGAVVDGDGRPLAGVEVRASFLPGEDRRSLFSRLGSSSVPLSRSSPEGRFRLGGLQAGAGYSLVFERQGLAPAELTVDPLEPFEERTGLRVVMTPGRRAVGWVVDETDAPVPGAEVALVPAFEGDETSRQRRVIERMVRSLREGEEEAAPRSDAEGRFEIPGLLPGRYDLEVAADGFGPTVVRGLEIPDGEGDFDLGVVVMVPGAEIAGRVVDPEGRPLAAAEVRVRESADGGRWFFRGAGPADGPADVTSDAAGRFVIPDRRPGEAVELWVSLEGHVSARVPGVVPPTEEPVEVVLQPASAVAGRVVDGDGRPVAMARVRVAPERQGGTGRMRWDAGAGRGMTGDDGRFEVTGVEPGSVTVVAEAMGFQSRRLSGLEVPAERPLEGVELVLEPGATLFGTVTEADGTPVTGAMVNVGEDAVGMGVEGFAITDGDGRFEVTGLGTGPRIASAVAEHTRRVTKNLEIEPGDNTVELVFEGGVELRGQVFDDAGAPVAGAEVRLSEERGTRTGRGGRWHAVSTSDGSFVIEGVTPGSYRLVATAAGFAPGESEEPFEVAGTPISGLRIQLEGGIDVVGRVLGLEYDDLVQVEVRAYARGSVTVRPDFEGRYRLSGLAPGEVTVVAEIPGSGRQVREQVTLEEGAVEVPLDLELGTGYTLTGEVLHGGEPVRGASLSLFGVDVGHSARSTTRQDGGFRVEGLEAGSYRLRVDSHDTGLEHSREVTIDGDDHLRIEIVTARITGRVVDAEDLEPIDGARVELRRVDEGDSGGYRPFGERRAESDARGFFSLGEVSEGSYRAVAEKAGYGPAEAGVVVRGSAVEEIELALRPTEGLTFRVALATGQTPGSLRTAFLDGAGRRVAGGRATPDQDGEVRIATVPAGSWEMLISAGDSAAVATGVTVPGDAGRVVLPAGGSLVVTVAELAAAPAEARLQLRGPDGRPYRGLGWQGDVVTEPPVRGGRAQASNLTPGVWTATVTAADGRSWSGTVNVTPGVIAELEL